MRLSGWICTHFALGICLAHAADCPPESAATQLRDLADSMQSHAQRVKNAENESAQRLASKGKELEARLSALISKLSPGQEKPPASKPASRLDFGLDTPVVAPERPAEANSKTQERAPSVSPSRDDTPIRVSTGNATLGRLPASRRDQILQTWGLDLDEHWRKRLEAYYLSVSAESAPRAADRK